MKRNLQNEEECYGKSNGYEEAYAEGYAAKYHQWRQCNNPYPDNSPESDGFDEGYCEAVSFS